MNRNKFTCDENYAKILCSQNSANVEGLYTVISNITISLLHVIKNALRDLYLKLYCNEKANVIVQFLDYRLKLVAKCLKI